MKEEENSSEHFESKPRTILSEAIITFNGTRVSRRLNGTIHTDQEDKIKYLTVTQTQKKFAITRANVQYVGVMTRPDICASTQLKAPGSEPSTQPELKIVANTIKTHQSTAGIGLKFVRLNLAETRITVMTDAASANPRN